MVEGTFVGSNSGAEVVIADGGGGDEVEEGALLDSFFGCEDGLELEGSIGCAMEIE